VIIVGAGVLGLSTAATLRARGHRVVVVDPGGPNASSVAAGMIAPAFEAALEGATVERAALYRAAAALWPAFAGPHGMELIAARAEWRGPDPDAVAARLTSLGFAVERVAGGVHAPEDQRLSPRAALSALEAGLAFSVQRTDAVGLERRDGGWIVRLAQGEPLRAPHVVIATGVADALAGLPAPVRRRVESIPPIRGQIGWTAEVLTDRTLRGPGVYVTPVDGGTAIGATMEEGRRDPAPDPDAGDVLRRAAEALLDRPIDPAPMEWRVGVRGATPDGLPMAGLGGGPGLHLALAPRRNGWLLGPLVGEVLADGIEGRAPGEWAAALDPQRFG
jgi:glycine oxidase